MANPISMPTGIINLPKPATSIIEKLKSPCKTEARKRPAKKKINLNFGRLKESATKYPNVPEVRACRKVAPTKRCMVKATLF